jgi:hypothetical protein
VIPLEQGLRVRALSWHRRSPTATAKVRSETRRVTLG